MKPEQNLPFLLKFWKKFATCLACFLPYYLKHRQKKGKEIRERLKERQGYTSYSPFPQKPIQFHAASVGELISILPLIEKIHQKNPKQNFLITTGTVTSFHILQNHSKSNENLAAVIHHQFIPLDVPEWIDRFLTYWNPSLIVLVESELWPNFIQQAHQRSIPLTLINARLSDRSLKKWLYFPETAKTLLSCFDWITCQSSQDQQNFLKLGIQTDYAGNLKQMAPQLSHDEKELTRLKQYFGKKPLWLAASTHATEEKFIVRVHEKLRQKWPDLITLIVPRHPERAADILTEIGTVAQRSQQQMPFAEGIWLCDTLGEMGLFYRLANIVFMGNSLETVAKGGGHNPFEPVMLGCAISTGPKIHNFTQAYDLLRNTTSIIHTETELMQWVDNLLTHPAEREKLADQSLQALNQTHEFMDNIRDRLLSLSKGKP